MIEVAIRPGQERPEKLSLSIKLAEEDRDLQSAPGFRKPGEPSSAAWASADILVDRMRQIQGRRPTSASSGCLQRVHQASCRTSVHPQEADGWLRPVHKVHRNRSPVKKGATSSRSKSPAGVSPAGVHPSVDAGAQDTMRYSVLAGYPLVNLKGHAARWRLRVTPRKWRSRSRARRCSKRHRTCAADPGTDHGGRVTTPGTMGGDRQVPELPPVAQIQAAGERSARGRAHTLWRCSATSVTARSKTQGRELPHGVLVLRCRRGACRKEIIAKATGESRRKLTVSRQWAAKATGD